MVGIMAWIRGKRSGKVGWGTGAVLVGLGASAFVVSDTILGWDRFVAAKRWGGVAVRAPERSCPSRSACM